MAPYAGVIVALTIGDQRAIPEPQWRVFNRTGITHLISISGLHVTVFAALAGGLAYRARAAQRAPDHARSRAQGRARASGVGVRGRLRAARRRAGARAVRTLLMLRGGGARTRGSRGPARARVVWLWALAIVLAGIRGRV